MIARTNRIIQHSFMALCVSCVLATGCATHRTATAFDPLVGHWRYADRINTAEYLFKTDGSFKGSVARDGKVVWEYAGRWSRIGGMLNYTYTKSSADWAPPGTKDQDALMKVERGYYIIEARDGSRRKYVRVE